MTAIVTLPVKQHEGQVEEEVGGKLKIALVCSHGGHLTELIMLRRHGSNTMCSGSHMMLHVRDRLTMRIC